MNHKFVCALHFYVKLFFILDCSRMAQLELDPHFIQGLRLLHSINKDSADQLRTLLDEAIRQKHGPVKMLCNVLHKKVIVFK